MDSSIRLQSLIGGLSWNAEEIPVEEWVAVLNHLLQKNAGLIEYLPAYKPIKDTMNGWQGSRDIPVTDLDIVIVPEGFSLDTKCVSLAQISHQVEGAAEHSYGWGVRYVYEKHLLLTHKGRLVLSDRKYERVFSGTAQRRGGVDLKNVTCSWGFVFCEGDALVQVLTSIVAVQVVDSLGALSAAGVRERRHRLRIMESFLDDLRGVREQVKGNWSSWERPGV